jgi:hypothetical protein
LAPPSLTAEKWLVQVEQELGSALLATANGLDFRDARLFACDKLRFPKESRSEQAIVEAAKALANQAYRRLPVMRVSDVRAHVARWTGFVNRFTHAASGLPPKYDRAFMAALLAEATNLGLIRMAESCSVASRCAMVRIPRLSDRKLYAFEPKARYGRLVPLLANDSIARSSRPRGRACNNLSSLCATGS